MNYGTRNIGEVVSAFMVNFINTNKGRNWGVTADTDTENPYAVQY